MMNLSEIFFNLGIQNPTLFYAVGFVAVLVTALSKAGFGGAIAIGIPILLLVLGACFGGVMKRIVLLI